MVKSLDDTTENKILGAARKVFWEKGMAGARMQDIADQAGINKALLHYYYRSKEKLFEVIFREASSLFFMKIAGIIESDIPLFAKIESFCGEYIAMLSQNPYLPLFVLNEANKQPYRFKQRFWKNRENLFERFARDIMMEIENKKIRPLKPAHLFMNMVSMCVFPFIAKPIWMMSSGMKEDEFIHFLEERKKIVPEFIICSIKK
ncbi:MAG TPA: TetR/AcrR family transcriptional regulator [Puia sp.]|nr:TetR/AcrR family transcriptional regulator [Puia sp.]